MGLKETVRISDVDSYAEIAGEFNKVWAAIRELTPAEPEVIEAEVVEADPPPKKTPKKTVKKTKKKVVKKTSKKKGA